jgi:uncharacterized protein with PQ loop repeat
VKFIQQLKRFPFHVIGVLLFFITNGYSDYIGLIPIGSLVVYFLLWLLISVLIFLFFRYKLKSFIKAGLITTFITSFFLFYGFLQDSLKSAPFLAILSRYIILLPGFIISLFLLYRYCKRPSKEFNRVTLYLNLLFILFIAFDIYNISDALISGKTDHLQVNNAGFTKNDNKNIKKVDIYFIVLDEYSGSGILRDSFNYDNSRFERSLKDQGFFVAQSPSSNYAYTALSMASTLNMDYLKWMEGRSSVKAEDYTIAERAVSESAVIALLRSYNYDIINFSIFDIQNQSSRFNTGLMPFKLKLITSKTLLSRMQKDLLWILHKYVAGRWDWVAKIIQSGFKDGNQQLIHLTIEATKAKKGQPKFVYTHLVMPHAPFLYDSTGKEVHINSFDESLPKDENDKAYLQYLVYTNKVVSALVDTIQQHTLRPAAIIVMSDHGYRGKNNNARVKNFNAVYLPGGDYKLFYDSLTNVNQFRIIFNTLFDQKLPLLKDSTCIF